MDPWLVFSLVFRVASLCACLVLVVRTRRWAAAVLAGAIAFAVVRLLQTGPDAPPVQVVTHVAVTLLSVIGTLGAYQTLQIHKRRELELQRLGEARLRRIMDSATEGIWSIDPNGRTTFVNLGLARLLGYTPAEMHGAHVVHFVAEDHSARARERLARPFEAPSVEVTRLRHKDGSHLWARLCVSSMVDANGNYEGALATVADITREKQVEQGARARDQVLMKFVSQAPLPELLNSVCLAIEAAVPHSRVAVLTREHAAGSLLFRAGPSLPPSLRQALDDPQSGTPLGCASQAVTTGEAAFFEDAPVAVGWRALVDHLHRAQVRSSWSFPIRAAHQGEVIGTVTCFLSRTALPTQAEQQVLGTYADLAQVALQQRRTEDELEQARGQLLAAIDQSPTGIVIAEAPSGRILVANRRALGETVGSGVDVGSMCYEQLPAGWESQDAEGQPIAREDLPLIQALEQGRTLRNVELFQRRGDGVKRWVLASAAPVRDSTGRVRAAVAVYFDITTRKRQEHDLQRLLRSLEAKTEELEQIFWTTTHDLRAPLVNVEGFARELQLGLDELEGHIATADLPIDLRVTLQALLSQELRFSLGHISSSAARMDQLMRGMARLNAVDRNAVAEERVDLGALLREVLGAFEYRLRQDEVQVEVGDLPVCTGDRSQLGQVFSNLVDNAIKYRDPERPARLVIDGWTRNNRAFVSLTDRGLGIEPEQLDKIFRPFHRVRPSGEVGGEGLGLAILQRILARVSGRIRVTSTPGEGSTFEVELPAAQQGLPSPRVGAAS